MEQKTASDGGDEIETYNLEVNADTVLNGLKWNDTPGEQRSVLFHKNMRGEYGSGTLRDVRGLMWDGDAPIQLRPGQFLGDHRNEVGSPTEAKAEARRIAEEEGDDPDEAAEVAYEIWEDQARHWLQKEIVVEARFEEETKTVYNIEYLDE